MIYINVLTFNLNIIQITGFKFVGELIVKKNLQGF